MIYTLVRRDSEGNVDAVISFDAVTSSNESWSATVTTQTVERGFNITDNINIEPPTYDIEAVISSYSLFNINSEIVWDGESFETQGTPDAQAHTKARDEIIKIFTDRSILTLLESTANSNDNNLSIRDEELKSGYHKEINSCVMTSLSISHPDSGTGAFYVSIKLQKIHVALVTTLQLQEGQMIPLLQPLKVQEKGVSSKTTESVDEDGNAVAADETDLGVDDGGVSVGMTDAEGAVKRARILSVGQDELKAIKAARDKSALTGQNWEPRYVSGQWWLYPTG